MTKIIIFSDELIENMFISFFHNIVIIVNRKPYKDLKRAP